jgi:hypothetical protein
MASYVRHSLTPQATNPVMSRTSHDRGLTHHLEVVIAASLRRGTQLVTKHRQLKIRELRSLAEKDLGPKADLRAFHDELLKIERCQ